MKKKEKNLPYGQVTMHNPGCTDVAGLIDKNHITHCGSNICFEILYLYKISAQKGHFLLTSLIMQNLINYA